MNMILSLQGNLKFCARGIFYVSYCQLLSESPSSF